MSGIEDLLTGCRDVVYEQLWSKLSPEQQWLVRFVVLLVLLPLVILIFVVCLYVKPLYPEFSVERLYVPAFNKTSGNATSNIISFDIKLRNRNSAVGLYYDGPLNVSFSFIPRETNSNIIWQYSVPKFYQGNAQSRRLRDVIKPLGAPHMPVFNQTVMAEHSILLPSADTKKGLEPLLRIRVDIMAKVRFRLIGKHHAKGMAVSADVAISATTGEKFSKSAIRASVGSGIGWGGTQSAMIVVLTAINLIFM